jgi:hypothetical protein
MKEKISSPFFSEAQLVFSFVEFLKNTNNNRYKCIVEYEGGFGRPDILLYDLPREKPHDVDALAKINPRLAPLLSIPASHAVTSLADLASISGVSLQAAKKIEQELRYVGHLKNNSPNGSQLEIRAIELPPFSHIVSIEAKLGDWRRALTQAYRYLQFSTESWVLLDHKRIASAHANLHLFQSAGVGLASFSLQGQLYVHASANNRVVGDSALAWRTQAMLARHYLND